MVKGLEGLESDPLIWTSTFPTENFVNEIQQMIELMTFCQNEANYALFLMVLV